VQRFIPSETAMNLEQAFLDAILADPSNFTPRLIFMDWLDEQGDPRGELLRLLHTLTQEIAPPDRPMLEARLRGLLERGVKPVGPFWTNAIGMKFALIPLGRFLMGSPASELERGDDETQHEVTLTKGFYLGVYPVTQEQWQVMMGNNPSYFKGQNLPVEQVSWNDCQEFVKKLSEQDRQPYRLPTEAEWEYACRAGTTTPFHFGSFLNGIQANCDGRCPYNTDKQGLHMGYTTTVGSDAANALYMGRTTEVGSDAANAWGLHDMHGNVYEWCEDYYGTYEGLDTKDPLSSIRRSNDRRVQRGGSWYYNARNCRAAFRSWHVPSYPYGNGGFRVAFRLD
jgi:uncharacterized protein (TIGR02996 family)